MIFTVLSRYPHLEKKTLSLIEREFRYNRENSFLVDFLPLIHKSNFKNCHIILEGEEVIGHIGVREETLSYRHVRVPVAFVGGIAVAEEFKGRGLFRKFFEKVLDIYRDHIAFFLLWSGNNSLFEKFRFFEFGVVYENNLKLKGQTIVPYEKVDAVAPFLTGLKKIYNEQEEKYLVVRRDFLKWKIIEHMTSLDFYLKMKNGTLLGYYVKNKGQDFQGIVHEFSDISGLNEPQVWGPVPFGNNVNTFFLGLMKIADGRFFATFIKDVTKNGIIVSAVNEKNIVFSLYNRTYRLTPKDFICSLWGPSFKEDMARHIPPLSISGIDST